MNGKVGSGSRFRLVLPLTAAASDASHRVEVEA